MQFENDDMASTVYRNAKMALKMQIDKMQFQAQRFNHYGIAEFSLKD
jgi:hypothetical protein